MEILKNSVFNLDFFEDFKKLWASSFSGDRGLNTFEAYCLYLFIRKYKPRRIKEMSPNNGFSTFVMIQAILDEGYENEIEIFDSYDLSYLFCYEAEEKISKIGAFNFFKGDAKDTFKLNEKIDFFFIDSDHSKNFSEWYINFLNFSDFIFIHDINPSEEYHLKFRGDHTENPYCGGEPLTVYRFLRERGYEYSKNKTFYPRDFVSSIEEGKYFAEWISVDNDDKNCEKIFWSLLNQIYFLEKKTEIRGYFTLPKETINSEYNQRLGYLFGPSQSLFFQNF